MTTLHLQSIMLTPWHSTKQQAAELPQKLKVMHYAVYLHAQFLYFIIISLSVSHLFYTTAFCYTLCDFLNIQQVTISPNLCSLSDWWSPKKRNGMEGGGEHWTVQQHICTINLFRWLHQRFTNNWEIQANGAQQLNWKERFGDDRAGSGRPHHNRYRLTITWTASGWSAGLGAGLASAAALPL